MQTLLDIRGNIPSFIEITSGSVHDVNILDVLVPEIISILWIATTWISTGSTTLRNSFLSSWYGPRKYEIPQTLFSSRRSKHWTHLWSSDQVGDLSITKRLSGKTAPHKYVDSERAKHLVFLTNNLLLPALTIADLYKCRWQVELFFKWIKQHLRIKAFYGTSENAVKTKNRDCDLCLYARSHHPQTTSDGA